MPQPVSPVAQPISNQDLVTDHPGDNPQDVGGTQTLADLGNRFYHDQFVIGHRATLADALMSRDKDIEDATGTRLPMTPDMLQLQAWDVQVGDYSLNLDGPMYWTKQAQIGLGKAFGKLTDDNDYEQRVEQLRAQNPDKMFGIPTRAQLVQSLGTDVQARASAVHADAASGPRAALFATLGNVGFAATDPVNLGLMGMTGGGSALFDGTALAADSTAALSRPLIGRVLASSARGALVNGAFQAAQIPYQVSDSQLFGPAYTWKDGLNDEAGAVVAGGALGPIMDGLGELLKFGGGKAPRELLRGEDLNPVERGSLEASDTVSRDELALRNLSPAEFEAAQHSLATGGLKPQTSFDQDITTLFDHPTSTGDAPLQPGFGDLVLGSQDYRGRPIYAATFDPTQLQTDPVRFQYKGGGDAAGVTDRLRGVQQWDPTASGKAIVWEDPNGTKIVADGHQRLGLAQRLVAQGAEGTRLDGYLLRSADGWTAGDARIVAALKNIREGSGTPLDAAKVFREAPQAINDRSLPITGDFIHQARGLARLGDEAFGAVLNKVIPERYGAILGDMAGDRPDLQPGLTKLLVDGAPANLDEARALVSEGMLDDYLKSEGSQSDLFGGKAPELSTIARAKVKASVLRSLRSNADLMASLIRKADAIEAGGNVLARDANEAAAATDRAALELVDKLSMRDGPIGRAMAEAAQAVAEGKRPGDAAKGVTEQVRQAIRDGQTMDLMRGTDIDPPPPSDAALKDLAAFDDPNGAGAKAQAAPAPENRALEVGQDIERRYQTHVNRVSETETHFFVEPSHLQGARGVFGHVEDAGGRWRIESAELPESARGRGEGVAMYERTLEEAQANGATVVTSDFEVKPEAAKIYDALERRGYVVERNPKAVADADGTLRTPDKSPIFEVRPKPAAEALHPGLFDDLPQVGAEERARTRLAACAPE